MLACGLNNYGQLALPGGAPVFAPTLVKALAGRSVAGVRGGQHHTLALTRGGGLLSFGRPTYGRLGQRGADVASDAACPEPQPVDGLAGVRVAGGAAGLAVSGALSDDGRGWLWGFGTSNQLAKGEDDEGEGPAGVRGAVAAPPARGPPAPPCTPTHALLRACTPPTRAHRLGWRRRDAQFQRDAASRNPMGDAAWETL